MKWGTRNNSSAVLLSHKKKTKNKGENKDTERTKKTSVYSITILSKGKNLQTCCGDGQCSGQPCSGCIRSSKRSQVRCFSSQRNCSCSSYCASFCISNTSTSKFKLQRFKERGDNLRIYSKKYKFVHLHTKLHCEHRKDKKVWLLT